MPSVTLLPRRPLWRVPLSVCSGLTQPVTCGRVRGCVEALGPDTALATFGWRPRWGSCFVLGAVGSPLSDTRDSGRHGPRATWDRLSLSL